MMYRGLIYASTLGVFGWNYHFLPEFLPSPWGMGALFAILLVVLSVTGGSLRRAEAAPYAAAMSGIGCGIRLYVLWLVAGLGVYLFIVFQSMYPGLDLTEFDLYLLEPLLEIAPRYLEHRLTESPPHLWAAVVGITAWLAVLFHFFGRDMVRKPSAINDDLPKPGQGASAPDAVRPYPELRDR